MVVAPRIWSCDFIRSCTEKLTILNNFIVLFYLLFNYFYGQFLLSDKVHVMIFERYTFLGYSYLLELLDELSEMM